MFKKIFNCIFIVLTIFMIVSCKDKKPNNNNQNNNNFENNLNCQHLNSSWHIKYDSTCTSLGLKELKCNECNKILTNATISLKEHNVEIIPELKPTCENEGLTEGKYCLVCQEILVAQEVINKISHNYILDNNKSDNDILVYECEICNHSYQEENIVGDLCHNGHVESDWVNDFEPTCTSIGQKHKECINCKIIIIIQEIEKIPHSAIIVDKVEPDCFNTGLTEGKKCNVCHEVIVKQEVISKTEHDYILINKIEPTQYENGLLEYQCSICKDQYHKDIPATGNYDESKTITINLSDDIITVTNNNGGVIIENKQVLITLPGEYDINGTLLEGNIIVRLLEDEKAILNLKGINLSSSTTNPIFIESGNKVEISAKKDTENFINDNRAKTDVDAVGGAIYSKVDLEVKGKGELYIESTYNNGIATTKDLEIKNIALNINVPNNALKGNDSITIESGTINAISSSGDALKTENTDVSDKGNQRGIITINGGTLDLCAAFDGIDAAYNVVINGGDIKILTDKYSGYTGEVVAPSNKNIYLRVSSKTNLTRYSYTYSAKFILSDNSVIWQSGTKDSSQQSSYYKFDLPENTQYVKFYVYSTAQTPSQESNYTYATDQIAISSSFDTYYVKSANSSNKFISGEWTTYGTGGGMGGMPPGGMGGPNDGNSEKETYSCKGIKADNEIYIYDGNINIKSRDDSIHTNTDVLLNDGSYGSGNININGGMIKIYSDDDGLHADGNLTINNGNVIIENSYEGVEGENIYFKGGTTQITSKDDGINAVANLNFANGIVYLNAGGDGIDSNNAITMTGGIVIAQGPANGGNGVLDYERSFTFSGGLLLAIGCSGMNQKPTATTGNTATSSSISTSTNSYVNVKVNGEIIVTLKVTKNSQNYCVFAYNNTNYPSAKVEVSTSTSNTLINELYYIKGM